MACEAQELGFSQGQKQLITTILNFVHHQTLFAFSVHVLVDYKVY